MYAGVDFEDFCLIVYWSKWVEIGDFDVWPLLIEHDRIWIQAFD